MTHAESRGDGGGDSSASAGCSKCERALASVAAAAWRLKRPTATSNATCESNVVVIDRGGGDETKRRKQTTPASDNKRQAASGGSRRPRKKPQNDDAKSDSDSSGGDSSGGDGDGGSGDGGGGGGGDEGGERAIEQRDDAKSLLDRSIAAAVATFVFVKRSPPLISKARPRDRWQIYEAQKDDYKRRINKKNNYADKTRRSIGSIAATIDDYAIA